MNFCFLWGIGLEKSASPIIHYGVFDLFGPQTNFPNFARRESEKAPILI